MDDLFTDRFTRPGTLLGVWAHPDDEAYLSAALMARATDAGWRVVVATATRGEQGTDDPEQWPPHRLGPVREQELARSLEIVGVTEHHWFDHADGGLADIDAKLGIGQVAALVEDLRPDVIVTFGPEGMTGHDDHRTISWWTTRAWQEAGSPGALWYATATPEHHEEWGEFHEQIGLWFEGTEPPVTPRHALAAEVICEGELLDRKHAALRAHATQTTGLEELMGTEAYRRWAAHEWFVAAAPDPAP